MPRGVLLKTPASGWPVSLPSGLPLRTKGKGTLRGTHPAPPRLSVPVGSWGECFLLPYKAGVTCHAIGAWRMSAMWGE